MAGRHNKYEECTLWFCEDTHYGRGLCAKHYQNWLRTGHALPERSYDLRVALDAVDQFRYVVSAFLSGNNAYLITKDGDTTVECKCKHCGATASYTQSVLHNTDCPVRIAEQLMARTHSEPPDDKYTYNL